MRNVAPVCNNQEKQRTYRENCAKYRKAMQEEFYFEAMLIAYAMLEDRLRSFLYHMGALNNRRSIRVNCVKTQLRDMVVCYRRKKENDSLGITNISGKMKIVRCSLEWASCVEGGYENDKYLVFLKKQYEGNIDIQEMLDAINELYEWLNYRNEIMHALMNKNVDSVNKELKQRTQQGMELARRFDKFVGQVKKGNFIRRSMKLCVEK